jgi:heat shock protein HtpX
MRKSQSGAYVSLDESSFDRFLFSLYEWGPVHFLRKAKVWIVLVLTTLFFSWSGYQIADRYGLLVGFFLAMALNSIVFFYVDWRLAGLFSGLELEGNDPWGILRVTRDESVRIGVAAPRVILLKSDAPASFSAGLFTRSAHLFLTEGLVRRLTENELRMLIAYETRKIKEDITQRATAAAAIASLVATTANAFDSVLFLPFKRENRQLRSNGPMTLLTSPFVALLLRFGVSHRSTLLLDRKVADSADRIELWAQTLQKMDSYSKTIPLDVNLAEAALFTVNPLARLGWCQFASVQPSLKTRLVSLTGRFPI